jgi:hypothetical protein
MIRVQCNRRIFAATAVAAVSAATLLMVKETAAVDSGGPTPEVGRCVIRQLKGQCQAGASTPAGVTVCNGFQYPTYEWDIADIYECKSARSGWADCWIEPAVSILWQRVCSGDPTTPHEVPVNFNRCDSAARSTLVCGLGPPVPLD